MFTQKEAVYQAISAITTIDPEVPVALSKEQKQQVADIVVGYVNSGEMTIDKGNHTSPEEIKTYAKSVISNWLKRDPRLTGGVPYKSNKSAPKAETTEDDGLTSMRKLKKILSESNVELSKDLDDAIDEKLAQTQQKRTSLYKEVNAASLPPDINDFLDEEIDNV